MPRVKQTKDDSLVSTAAARSYANPGAKLLEAARDLFNEQGYASAGINEIIERSQTSKKSFYYYFPSKKALGEAFLRAEADDVHEYMASLFSAYPANYPGFARRWAADLRTKAAEGGYYGCPFANAAAQAPDDFRSALSGIMADWQKQLAGYFTGLFSTHQKCVSLARRVLSEYEGAVQMWRLTNDASYFSLFERALLDLITGKRIAAGGTSSRRGTRVRPEKTR